MSAGRPKDKALQPVEHLFLWALGISLTLHVLLYGSFLLGQHYGWWKKDLMPSWMKSTQQKLAEIKKLQEKQVIQQPHQQEPPLLFVEVDPSVATQDAPKKATHYSSRNSHAANPDVTIDSNIPNINGKQSHVTKTQDAERSKPVPLRPSPPKTPLAESEAAEEAKQKPKGGPASGDLAMAKSAEKPGDLQVQGGTGEAKVATHKRPHTLLEAMQQNPSHLIPGQKMKQTGGVRHHLDSSAFDVIATGFGEYDRELIDAITTHWWDLLDRKEFSRDRTGRVVIQFRLHYDGRVTDVQVLRSEVGDLLTFVCQESITDPAPYAPWPADMRRSLANDSIDVTFTFWYD